MKGACLVPYYTLLIVSTVCPLHCQFREFLHKTSRKLHTDIEMIRRNLPWIDKIQIWMLNRLPCIDDCQDLLPKISCQLDRQKLQRPGLKCFQDYQSFLFEPFDLSGSQMNISPQLELEPSYENSKKYMRVFSQHQHSEETRLRSLPKLRIVTICLFIKLCIIISSFNREPCLNQILLYKYSDTNIQILSLIECIYRM